MYSSIMMVFVGMYVLKDNLLPEVICQRFSEHYLNSFIVQNILSNKLLYMMSFLSHSVHPT